MNNTGANTALAAQYGLTAHDSGGGSAVFSTNPEARYVVWVSTEEGRIDGAANAEEWILCIYDTDIDGDGAIIDPPPATVLADALGSARVNAEKWNA